MATSDCIELVKAERARQDAQWGKQDHSPREWYAIIGEEFGEVSKAINEGASRAHYVEELSHVAACCVAAMENAETRYDVGWSAPLYAERYVVVPGSPVGFDVVDNLTSGDELHFMVWTQAHHAATLMNLGVEPKLALEIALRQALRKIADAADT